MYCTSIANPDAMNVRTPCSVRTTSNHPTSTSLYNEIKNISLFCIFSSDIAHAKCSSKERPSSVWKKQK